MGPGLLVLGDIPQKNGLGISLLERLHLCYQEIGDVASTSIATLSANYRCHTEIINLVGKLFYKSQLSWAEGEQLPVTHRDYKYPLAFIVSDCDISGTFLEDYNQIEVDYLVDKALQLVRSSPAGWGKPAEVLQQLFLVSPCEEQVCMYVCMCIVYNIHLIMMIESGKSTKVWCKVTLIYASISSYWPKCSSAFPIREYGMYVDRDACGQPKHSHNIYLTAPTLGWPKVTSDKIVTHHVKLQTSP